MIDAEHGLPHAGRSRPARPGRPAARPGPGRRMAAGAALLAALVVSAWLLPAAATAQAADPSTTGPTSTTTSTSTSTSTTPDSTTTTGPPTTPTSTPDTTTTTTSPSTTTLPQIGQGPLPGAPPPATTVPAPAVTVPPEQLRSLLEGLQAELDQFAAIDTYRRDRVMAVNAATGAAASNTLVAQAHQAVVKAMGTQDAVVSSVGTSIRNLSGLAIALYVHEDVASQSVADSFNGSIEDRQVMLSILLEGGQHKVKASRQVASAATDATREADNQLAQAEAAQAVAHRARDHAAAVLAADQAAALGRPGGTAASSRSVKPGPATGPNVTGPPVLTADELAAWFASTGHRAATTVGMPALAADYVEGGKSEGVQGDVAFAQSVIETGYFGFPAGGQLGATDNNFAGIGACDGCAHGWVFPDAQTGVAAQLQLLHAYASPTPVPTPLVGKVFVAGCCRTWLALTGVWATAPAYGYEVLSIYKQIVDWVLPRRLAAAGLTPPVPPSRP